ncbi:MAG TPA: alpha/beta fold hydrolase [Thermoanaerobaculia bacterium]|nr:alpha/beta fold hydrolase [Thermoanaerobaculia bacterium]
MAGPLYVLSGLGADERLFAPQRAARDVRGIELVSPAPREPLAGYAARLAGTLDLPREFDLAGASFGGMIALELARHVSPRRVYLLGSCRSPASISPMLRALHRFAFRPPRFTHALIARYFGATSSDHVELFSGMLAATPPAFFDWAVRAIFTWRGVAHLPMPVVHVHGDRDRLIPLARVWPDHVIAGAGHLLTLTHAAEVNALL